MNDPAELLQTLLHAGIAAADPLLCVPPILPQPPRGRTIVIGAGKAAARMAQAVVRHWTGEIGGVIVTREGHLADCAPIEVIEAPHPVPGDAALTAADKILAAVADAGPDDLVMCLISGGGSALLEKPLPGISLADIQSLNHALLRSGAPISAINCVRKHLSAIKGGRLAQAIAPARCVTIAISDVPGDEPSVIASGPTVPDPTTRQAALAYLERHGITIPDHLAALLNDEACETPKPDNSAFSQNSYVFAARPKDMLAAVAENAKNLDLDVIDLDAELEGEASDLGAAHAKIALEHASRTPLSRPLLIISGGETTVTLAENTGRGGRNLEYLLSLAIGLDGARTIHALACDTDGIDGSEDAAGALIGPDILGAAGGNRESALKSLRNHDSYGFFDRAGALIKTGPTRTNVNDLRLILITPAQ